MLEALANRLVREAILNALPRIAPATCAACITALDAGRSKTYLAALQIETQVVRNYMASR